MNKDVAFLMVVGPGEGDMAIDSLDSIRFFHPEADIWLLDDCTQDGTYEQLKNWASNYGAFLYRNQRPNGYLGLVNSLFSMFLKILESNREYKFVIKMDTDAVIMNKGLELHISKMFNLHGPGMIGVYKFSPSGLKRKFRKQGRNILLDMLPLGIDKHRRKLRIGSSFITPYFFRALKNGYVPGEHVLGGLYALHLRTLSELKKIGFLENVSNICSGLTLEEDILISLGVKAVGHNLIEINPDKDHIISWIQYKPPVPLSIEKLLAKGVMALHPLKKDNQGNKYRLILKQRRVEQK